MSQRNTIAREVTVTGTALHAGVAVTMILSPAPSGQGVVFRRGPKEIPARYDLVGETRLGTVIEKDGVRVGVIEHLMAAIAGAGLDDVNVSLDGPEPPILDGSAAPLVADWSADPAAAWSTALSLRRKAHAPGGAMLATLPKILCSFTIRCAPTCTGLTPAPPNMK